MYTDTQKYAALDVAITTLLGYLPELNEPDTTGADMISVLKALREEYHARSIIATRLWAGSISQETAEKMIEETKREDKI